MCEGGWREGGIPSSASMLSPGTTFSSSLYSGSLIASGLTSSAFLGRRSLPSHPEELLGVVLPLAASCPVVSSSLTETCGSSVVSSFLTETCGSSFISGEDIAVVCL